MAQVFASVAFGVFVVLVGTAVLGFMVEGERWEAQHLACGVFASVALAGAHILAMMYFAVTGKVVNQAVSLGKLDPAPSLEITRHKARVTALLGASVLCAVATIALGAVTIGARSWHWIHFASAMLTIVVNVVGFIAAYPRMVRTAKLRDEVMDEYNRVRAEWAKDAEKAV